MTRIFEQDIAAKVYSELSSDDPNRVRLNTLASVKRMIDRKKVPLIVFKPLVETQRADELLGYFNHSKAFWMYRDYKTWVCVL